MLRNHEPVEVDDRAAEVAEYGAGNET